MPELRLTPGGHLLWILDDGAEAARQWQPFHQAFEKDWREGLFLLAARKPAVHAAPSLRYWQTIAEQYLTRLCHIPEETVAIAVSAPDDSDLSAWQLMAPPMQGGEYLSADMLGAVWNELDRWVCEQAAGAKHLGAFLASHAPKWHQVGRVCFHLAENKADPRRPFAFMASFTTGFNASGQVKHQPLRLALEQYAGEKNKAALIRLLSPVQLAAERLPWVKRMVDSGEIYQPMAWTPSRAYQLLNNAAELEAAGLSVRLPNWWQKRPRPRVAVSIGNETMTALGLNTLLDFNVEVMLEDLALSVDEINALLASEDHLVMLKGQWVEVDRDKLRQALRHWEQVRQQANDGEIGFIEGMRLLAGTSADLKPDEEEDEIREWVQVNAGAALRETLAALRAPDRLAEAETHADIHATLRPYQRTGVSWLRMLAELGLGACLADDMGLGKTLQVLTLLQGLRNAGKEGNAPPSLLVVPASLLGNWRAEAQRFAPRLRLMFLHAAEKDKTALAKIARNPDKHLMNLDLLITTYAMVNRTPWLAERDWRLVILDEAQAIKNPGSQQTKAVKKLRASARIALTGTPVENRVGDLWSIFDFLNPGLLGSAKVFNDFIKNLQRRESNQFAPLRQLTAPYILRRLKTDKKIIADLPEKTEVAAYCTLSPKQVALYGQTVDDLADALRESEGGIARRGLVLQYLMRFKQLCNHPSQMTGTGDYRAEDSGKFQRLAEICEEIAARQEKALIFTQFREIIDALETHLTGVFGRGGLTLHGGTSVNKRAQLVDAFQREDGPPFFILSLKAGGSGLNLTAASHVIHFDRWWNPAVENQATDRAFRIGQKKNVLVHKFIACGTVEEQIDLLIAEKRQLAQDLLSGDGEINLTELSDDAILNLVRLDVSRATA